METLDSLTALILFDPGGVTFLLFFYSLITEINWKIGQNREIGQVSDSFYNPPGKIY